MVTLSITSCKRLHLFEKTIKSFYDNCEDNFSISHIYHFDDSSANEDRLKMETILRFLFPSAHLHNYRFDGQSFPGKKRHCYVMIEWLNVMKSGNFFNFHLEDDWLFNSKFSLYELRNFLEMKSEAAYVGVSQFLRDFPDDMKAEIEGNYWKWYYDPDKELLSNLFLDTKTMEKTNIDGFWCYFINWPYFGFRPGLWNTSKLEGVEKFNCELDSSFELDFAVDLAKKHVSYCRIDSICEHIGNESSAYDINNSTR